MEGIVKHRKELPELLSISKRAGKAIMDYEMLQAGDKVAVAVSGGKDSISLLHVLRHRQRIIPIRFELAAVHIDFGFSDFSPELLLAYLAREGFTYYVEKVNALADQRWEDLDCFIWSRHRRKALFDWMEKNGFNKLALGHHMDDIVETILLNQFYRAEIGAMKPKQELFGGKVTIIRPLAYERESSMIDLAEKLNLSQIGGQSKCANDETSHRMIIKKMLREMEQVNPMIVSNVFKSLQNIRGDYLLDTPDAI